MEECNATSRNLNLDIRTPLNPLYQALDPGRGEIRLLEIISTRTHGDIQCQFHVVSLDDGIAFTALSYVWGDSKVTEEIFVDGTSLKVTVNLATALRKAEYHWQSQFPGRESSEFRIWADAACINQNDVPERNSQVQLMRKLYSQAELVLSWLGTGSENNMVPDPAFQALTLIAQNTKGLDVSSDLCISWLEQHPDFIKPSGVDSELNMHWDAIHQFFRLPYFQRLWIFQEMVLARRVLFARGVHSIDYANLELAARWLFETSRQVQEGGAYKPYELDKYIWVTLGSGVGSWWRFESVYTTKDFMRSTKDTNSIWALFPSCRYLAATNPRDHIYGLLGLAPCGLVPDYALSVVEVYREYISSYMRDTRRLDVLRYSGIGMENHDVKVPSWTPNYQHENAEEDHFRMLGNTYIGYNADDGVFPNECHDAPAVISGLSIFAPTAIGPTVTKVHEKFDSGGFAIVQEFTSRYPVYVTGIHPLKAFFQVMIGDQNLTGLDLVTKVWQCLRFLDPPNEYRPRRGRLLNDIHPGELLRLMLGEQNDWRHGWLWCFMHVLMPDKMYDVAVTGPIGSFLQVKEWEGQNPSDSDAGDWAAGMSASIRLSSRYRIAETEGGYIGAVPVGTRSGDCVCVVRGCDTLLILRKVETHYVQIGPCFFVGLSDGEIRDLLGPADPESAEHKAQLINIEIR
ncbi:Nn.00g006050.m01.CDS01 [Neocucurbitaria sp. VM-36]